MIQTRGKRTLLALVLTMLCAGVIAACGSSSSSSSPSASATASKAATNAAATTNKSPINVALITFKIPSLVFIPYYEGGADAALKYINSIGGWGGRSVNLIACNSMLAPGPTADCAHETLADHVVAEFGCEPSWSAAGLALYASAGIPSFNCANTKADFTNPLSFGMGSGEAGESSATAKWICASQPEVQRIAYIAPAVPEQEADVPPGLNSAFKACGKTISYTWVPLTAVDMTPFVVKALSTHPQWVIMTLGPPQIVLAAKGLQAQGFPSDHIATDSANLDTQAVLSPAGSALNGAYASDEWTGWGVDTPDAATYREWVEKTGAPDPLSGLDAQGWMYMMWLYTAAKNIGFANFDAKTLTNWLDTKANGIHIPMSRTYISPGPAGTPSVHQPYVQMLQWKDGKMTVATQGSDAGWIMPTLQ